MTATATLLLRRAAGALAVLCLGVPALAQTAPAWVSARTVGPGSNTLGGTAVDAAGNTYETGNFNTATFVLDGVTLTSQGGPDAYLAKFTPAGALAWVRQIGSTGVDTGVDVAVDAAGNAYVTGFAGASLDLGNNVLLSGTASRSYVVRYSPLGTPEWGQQSVGFGGGGGIGTDAAGSVYVAGVFARTVSFDAATTTSPNNGFAAYLARFSAATGAVQSLVTAYYYDTPTGAATYQSPRLAVTPSGETCLLSNFTQPPIVGSATLASRGASDVLVARYTAQGALQWVQQFGGAGADLVNDGVMDAAGNVYAAGNFTGPADFGSTTLPGAADFDGYLVKCSPAGAVAWAQALEGPGPDGFGSLGLDAAGNPYAVGNFSAGAQLGIRQLANAGNRDLLVAAFTPQGQVLWTQQAGGPGFDSPSHVGVSANGDLHILGRFANTCVFGSLSLTTTAVSETFLARLSNSPLATAIARPLALGLYPNPATDAVYLPGLAAGTRVQLLDALGRVVREAVVSPAGPVSVRGLAPGLYTLRATTAAGQYYGGRLTVE